VIRVELSGRCRALFTARADGNLSTTNGEDHDRARLARERLCEDLGLRGLSAGVQVHGSVVRRHRMRGKEARADASMHADGQATCVSRAGMMVLAADCLPVILGSDRAVAALHAGWRGLAAGVLEEGVRALRELEGEPSGYVADARADGRPIVAIVGPSAGPCCYEVGPEVHAALAGNGTGAALASRTGRSPDDRADHTHGAGTGRSPDGVGAVAGSARASSAGSPIDLRAIARRRLLAAGVAQVRDVGLCTICDPRFFSHRRESDRAGRQAAIAWLQ
jgi:YfiH family protein